MASAPNVSKTKISAASASRFCDRRSSATANDLRKTTRVDRTAARKSVTLIFGEVVAFEQ